MRQFGSLNAAMMGLAHDALEQGVSVSPRDMKTYDLLGESFIIQDPRNRLVNCRPIRNGYGPAKIAWDLGERSEWKTLEKWNPNAGRFQDGVRVQGENYGERFSVYLEEALQIMHQDNDTRRAWIPIWMPYDLVNPERFELMPGNNHGSVETPSRVSANVPCTLGLNLRIVEGAVVMQGVMRSQSLWGVMPYDIFVFTVLQELIANELGLEMGWYEHFILSAHVYDRERGQIETALESSDFATHPAPMERIDRTLSDAAERWPALYQALSDGEIQPFDAEDPIEQMLVANAPVLEAA